MLFIYVIYLCYLFILAQMKNNSDIYDAVKRPQPKWHKVDKLGAKECLTLKFTTLNSLIRVGHNNSPEPALISNSSQFPSLKLV
jgi:hypothetical protein